MPRDGVSLPILVRIRLDTDPWLCPLPKRARLEKVAAMLLGRPLNSLQESQDILRVSGRRTGYLLDFNVDSRFSGLRCIHGNHWT